MGLRFGGYHRASGFVLLILGGADVTDRYKNIVDNFVHWGISSSKLHVAFDFC